MSKSAAFDSTLRVGASSGPKAKGLKRTPFRVHANDIAADSFNEDVTVAAQRKRLSLRMLTYTICPQHKHVNGLQRAQECKA